MEEEGDHEISGCGSTTTTTTVDDDIGYYWNQWSPVVVDLGTFCANDHDFRSLMESMMSDDMDCEDGVGAFTGATCTPSVTTTTCSTSPWLPADEPSHDEKGLRLVHLLMGAAEALTGPHQSRELARVILVRLKELVSTAGGSNMERLAAHFTDALQGLLDGSHPATATRTAHRDNNHQHHNPADVLTAFQLLQDMSPYVKFGHFTANQAILEAMSGERRVHIIDYDIAEGVQWASLMQAMVSQPNGPPPSHLRITAVARGGGGGSRGVQETGRRLAAFAASLGQPFSFGQCRLDADEHFRPAGIRVVKGEVVLANCALHHASATSAGVSKQSARPVLSFLLGVAELGPRVVTMVEEEAGEDQDEGGGFVERFMEELHRYSALWDSLEAGFPTQCCRVRGLVERVILGPKIAGAVGRAFRGGGGEGEGKGGWGEWMRGMGFKGVDISCFNHCQARLLLGLFNDGYRVEENGHNKLVLGWKARRLLSASVWSPPPSPSLPASPASVLPSASGFVAGLGLEDYDSFLIEPFGLV